MLTRGWWMAEIAGFVYFVTNDPHNAERLTGVGNLTWSWDGERGVWDQDGAFRAIAWADVVVAYQRERDLEKWFIGVVDGAQERCPDLKYLAARLGDEGSSDYYYLLSDGRDVSLSGYASVWRPDPRPGRPPKKAS